MQRKKKSFRDTFAELQNIGISNFIGFMASAVANSTSDISYIKKDISNQIELLNNNCFITIGNLNSSVLQNVAFVSENVKSIIGYNSEDFIKGGLKFFHDIYCQADKKAASEFLKLIIEHQKKCKFEEKHIYTYTSTFRLFHKIGYFKWFKSNWIFLQHNEKGKPTISVSIVTDIDNLKKNDFSYFEICKHIPEKNEYIAEIQYKSPPEGLNLLTDVDRTILRYLANGKSNREIGEIMNFSEHKVKDFRKKMLKKTWCSNVTELVYFAYRNNLINSQ